VKDNCGVAEEQAKFVLQQHFKDTEEVYHLHWKDKIFSGNVL